MGENDEIRSFSVPPQDFIFVDGRFLIEHESDFFNGIFSFILVNEDEQHKPPVLIR